MAISKKLFVCLLLGIIFINLASAQGNQEEITESSYGWLDKGTTWNEECQSSILDDCWRSRTITFIGNDGTKAEVFIEEYETKINNSFFISLFEEEMFERTSFYEHNLFYLPRGNVQVSGGYDLVFYSWYSNKNGSRPWLDRNEDIDNAIVTIYFEIPTNNQILGADHLLYSYLMGFIALPSDLNFGSEGGCLFACELEGECVPQGYRTSNEYCDENYTFSAQLEDGYRCRKSYECISEYCYYKKWDGPGECVSQKFRQNLIQRILEFFRNLFRRS